MKKVLNSKLYTGCVMHKRLVPQHKFRTSVFSLFLDLDELEELPRRFAVFSHNRWNLLSLMDRDYGPRDGTALKPWILQQLREADIHLEGGKVFLFTFPRVFGYVFNPLSTWFCYEKDGSLRAILYEVRNTFGEKHGYLFPLSKLDVNRKIFRHSCEKKFYVSPLLPPKAQYDFILKPPAKTFAITIRQSCENKLQMVASQTSRCKDITSINLYKALIKFPFMTFKIISDIHLQALVLWLKGAKYYKHFDPPGKPISVEDDPLVSQEKPPRSDRRKSTGAGKDKTLTGNQDKRRAGTKTTRYKTVA